MYRLRLWGSAELACRVIVVEDEPLIAGDIKFAALEAGCEVVGIARTCEEALSMLDADSASGAILDANLSGQSAKPIIDHLDAKGLPYIIVSGYMRDQLEFVRDDVALIGKPFSMIELTETIRREIIKKSGAA